MSLGMRAAVAVVLMVVFYAAAVGAIVGCIVLAATLATHLDQLQGQGLLMGVVVVLLLLTLAVIVAWSVLPRWDRYIPPGPEVAEWDHPLLFVEIRKIAEATGQQIPRHVYLTTEVNAYVTQRGGLLGLGSRRVMVLGLPLMRAMQVDELRGVLAHEMGHFVAGDTHLAPWIYKTRAAMIRILDNVSRLDRGWHAGWSTIVGIIRLPFHGVLLGYMRVTEAISRAQELGADALAVRVAGRRAVIAGLEKAHVTDIAYEAFFLDEVRPLLDAGMLPPIGEGFSRFLDDPALAARLDEARQAQLTDPPTTPYDSHPALRDRIAAVAELADSTETPDERRAIDLIADAAAVELEIVRVQLGLPLDPVTWDEVPAAYAKRWREDVEKDRKVLARFRTDNIPTDERQLYELAVDAMGMTKAGELPSVRQWWTSTARSALAAILLDEGFTLSVKFREPLRFIRGDVTLDLFKEVDQLVYGMMKLEEWNALWKERGVSVRALSGQPTLASPR